MKHFYETSELQEQRRGSGRTYLEFLRVAAMTAEIYALPAGGTDPQRPHNEDEVYYVIRGRAQMRVAEEDQPVTAGSLIFVEAGMEHRFHDIEEDLEVLVFFAPAES